MSFIPFKAFTFIIYLKLLPNITKKRQILQETAVLRNVSSKKLVQSIVFFIKHYSFILFPLYALKLRVLNPLHEQNLQIETYGIYREDFHMLNQIEEQKAVCFRVIFGITNFILGII